jgi:serine/threonine protein kinase
LPVIIRQHAGPGHFRIIEAKVASKIGRFAVEREISKGKQGAVYLAHDPQLDRAVAIKTLRAASRQQSENLLREARIASKFQHPNIVTLHDAGEQDGQPYLVYAYVRGETLAQMLKRSGRLPLPQAARLAAGVLDGLAYAHQQGVMHLDIKPANVMVPENGQPMLLDFGISRHIEQHADTVTGLSGTPQYMAPERVSAQGAEFRSDIFSAGIMLYEMVTGKQAIAGDTLFQILNRAAHESVAAPSTLNPEIDERLEEIILKAVARKPEERFPDAAAMRQALINYLDASQGGDAEQGKGDDSTLEFLMRRMRSKSDFPALSGTISEINKIVSTETDGPSKLAKVILQDFALTNKLLKVVNTASFGHFGGNINTISKAVVILGFDTVRNIAMTLILLEFLQNKAQAAELKDEVIASFFAGILAAELASGGRPGDAEEAMICAMFRNLGHLLATFYFFEESHQVARLMEDQGIGEEQAAIKVLGISYEHMGAGVAEKWNFPSRLVAGMGKLGEGKARTLHNEIERLKATANLANELCKVSAITGVSEKDSELRKLCARYEDALPVTVKKLSGALESGLHDLSLRSGILGIESAKSPLLKRIRRWSGHEESRPTEDKAPMGVLLLDSAQSEVPREHIEQNNPEAILTAGIQDVTNALVEDYKLNDILQVVMETIYRSFRFKHAVIFIRDNRLGIMAARSGFGDHIDALLPRLRFPLAYEPDAFHLAIEKGADIVIEDAQATAISGKIPGWYRDTMAAQYFLLLPIMVNKKAIGLIYAGMQEANSLKISPQQLTLLRTLRNQAVLAFKQKLL